jgi:hypothetical protein
MLLHLASATQSAPPHRLHCQQVKQPSTSPPHHLLHFTTLRDDLKHQRRLVGKKEGLLGRLYKALVAILTDFSSDNEGLHSPPFPPSPASLCFFSFASLLSAPPHSALSIFWFPCRFFLPPLDFSLGDCSYHPLSHYSSLKRTYLYPPAPSQFNTLYPITPASLLSSKIPLPFFDFAINLSRVPSSLLLLPAYHSLPLSPIFSPLS